MKPRSYFARMLAPPPGRSVLRVPRSTFVPPPAREPSRFRVRPDADVSQVPRPHLPTRREDSAPVVPALNPAAPERSFTDAPQVRAADGRDAERAAAATTEPGAPAAPSERVVMPPARSVAAEQGATADPVAPTFPSLSGEPPRHANDPQLRPRPPATAISAGLREITAGPTGPFVAEQPRPAVEPPRGAESGPIASERRPPARSVVAPAAPNADTGTHLEIGHVEVRLTPPPRPARPPAPPRPTGSLVRVPGPIFGLRQS
jgi:hypothetical protein